MRHIRIAACLSLAFALPAAAQDNIGHTRHTHKHGDPHPRVVDGERFFTNRDSGRTIELPEENDSFTFVVFGDRTGGPDAGVAVLADAVRDVNLLEPDLVMTVGDLIQGYNQRPEWMTQMREFHGIMNELLCPWFPVAGNHDIYWRGDNRPPQEHEDAYEMHFGPLWYAFEHKDCMFVVLYSDEGNPETGERAINKPASQTMSPEQLAWLQETLDLAEQKDIRDVFVFLHHPRWIGGRYGDDWEKVHKVLADSGRVRAAFAGHIHRMRYDGPRDGIEYITLATVGGHQNGTIPDAGYLHHYHTVTVRDGQFSVAALPVGEVLDVREITHELQQECETVAAQTPSIDGVIEIDSDGRAETTLHLRLRNTVSRPLDITFVPDSDDSRWVFSPDHAHMVVDPGVEARLDVRVSRITTGDDSGIDQAFHLPMVHIGTDYLAKGFRYEIPERSIELPVRLSEMPAPPVPTEEMVLRCDGRDDVAMIPASRIELPQGPFTLECWCRGDRFNRRVGVVAKTEGSEYGFFANNGVPQFSVHLGGRYVEPTADTPLLKDRKWHHLAGVYDGTNVSLYVDGKLVAQEAGTGTRTVNALPLVIGADVDGGGRATSHFDGQLDGVRLSTIARYQGNFTPLRRLQSDDDTLLLLNMDASVGPWIYDESKDNAMPVLHGGATIGAAR